MHEEAFPSPTLGGVWRQQKSVCRADVCAPKTNTHSLEHQTLWYTMSGYQWHFWFWTGQAHHMEAHVQLGSHQPCWCSSCSVWWHTVADHVGRMECPYCTVCIRSGSEHSSPHTWKDRINVNNGVWSTWLKTVKTEQGHFHLLQILCNCRLFW